LDFSCGSSRVVQWPQTPGWTRGVDQLWLSHVREMQPLGPLLVSKR